MDKSKQTKKKGSVFIAIGLLLIAAALSLTLYNYWDSARANKAAQQAVTQLEQQILAAPRPELALPDYLLSGQDTPSIPINGYNYIGVLEIPSLNLSLPVMEEWDYARLRLSPCRFSGSYYTDDMVIAGHNYTKHFSPIKWVKPGSDVYFTTVEGTVYHYAVDLVETLQPTQVDDMVSGDWDLTLFTCNIGGRTRCTVRCIRAT